MSTANPSLFIGLMSGTSLDGVDGVLASFSANGTQLSVTTRATAYVPFPDTLRTELMALQAKSDDEIHREALAADALARHYADCIAQLLAQNGIKADAVAAVGMHGQTIRHRPEAGYTRQIGNAALLAELSGIDVIADFRSRDIAAGGQGAPLVPAFHRALFGKAGETRVVANIGGISNISILNKDGSTTGFDTGPGNVLMDAWIKQHQGKSYDAEGAWAANGEILPPLLQVLREETYFALPPPKSTGRDLFHPAWLAAKLQGLPATAPENVQATLAAFTASTLADAIAAQAPDARSVHVCGGGAYNSFLMQQLSEALRQHDHSAALASTAELGVPPHHVEALAFAWLAQRFVLRQPGNLPAVTGARGPRILGVLHPAR